MERLVDPSHRFWAIRHDPVSDQILFQTASAGGVWMTRATVSRVLDITALKVELKAGTHQAEQNRQPQVSLRSIPYSLRRARRPRPNSRPIRSVRSRKGGRPSPRVT